MGYFRQFLLGRRFVCHTDHAALTSLFRTPEPVVQQARYLDLLGEYDMEAVHQPGASHQNNDALSCHPCEWEEEETACRQCHHTGREKKNRAVRVMTRRQLSTTAKQKEKTTYFRVRDTPLAGSDQRGSEGRGLHANYPRSVGRGV